jgi:hypothetical protein
VVPGEAERVGDAAPDGGVVLDEQDSLVGDDTLILRDRGGRRVTDL